MSLCGTLAHLRGQDRTELDAEKKRNLARGGLGQSGHKKNKKAREGHSLAHVGLPRTWKKKRCQRGAVYNWSVHGESE